MSSDRGTDAEKNSGACSIRERRPEGERMRSPGQNENAIRQADAKLILGASESRSGRYALFVTRPCGHDSCRGQRAEVFMDIREKILFN